jgi:hypothetical protein
MSRQTQERLACFSFGPSWAIRMGDPTLSKKGARTGESSNAGCNVREDGISIVSDSNHSHPGAAG